MSAPMVRIDVDTAAGFGDLATRLDRLDRDPHSASITVILDPRRSSSSDPFVIAAWAACRTRAVRLCPAVPVAHWQPYLIARRLCEIDKIAGGRLSWAPLDDDHGRRAESIAIVSALLDSWPAEALRNDRASGIQVDTDALRTVTFSGDHFQVRTSLDAPRGPQGIVPVLTLGAGT